MTNEEYSNLRDDIKCLIMDLIGDPDIRRAIGEALVELPQEYVEDFRRFNAYTKCVRPAVHADTSSIPEYRPIRPEAEK